MNNIVRLLIIEKAKANNLTFEEVAEAVNALYYHHTPATDWEHLSTKVIVWEGANNIPITPENADEVISELFSCIMD